MFPFASAAIDGWNPKPPIPPPGMYAETVQTGIVVELVLDVEGEVEVEDEVDVDAGAIVVVNEVVELVVDVIASVLVGCIVVDVVTSGTVLVVNAVVLVVVDAREQWHCASHGVLPSSHKAPGGSHCSPRVGVTTASPHRAAQSSLPAAQHVRHSRTKLPQAFRSNRAVPLDCRRHCCRSEELPTHCPRSASK